jgi:acetyl-CoA synthetase
VAVLKKSHYARLFPASWAQPSGPEVILVAELPKTQSGKIVRRLIRQRYFGKPLGDLSTVANPWALE